MKIELLPVLEIAHDRTGIPLPEQGPYWKYPAEYARYHQQCLALTGYDPMVPYLLERFAGRLQTIDRNAQWNIPEIDKLLIWGA